MNWTSLSAKGGGKSLTCGFLPMKRGRLRDFRSSFKERKGGFLFQKLCEVFLLVFSNFRIR